ncbi:chemotaxis protein [Burkholderia lata]|uniref:Chemotaxis protein n=1 Tax=Burkholderia lata (strain ATCC 17760 / DSM 23089 / LMG 22485 / NCIMB 9086 / R18194 / 383) TaxID=482957 RepID=A0A6P2VBI3_BURL3|nr:EamA family transporter RarD [Burkholderia lata]VWC76613.1 chemotaxis protein [Burkholderia lata]
MSSVRSVSTAAGVGFSLAASALFALMYYYANLLTPLGSLSVYGWRMLLTFPLLTLFLLVSGQGPNIRELCVRAVARPLLWLLLPVSSFLFGIQLWLFMWAPINGHALDVSLGYFLLPLVLVLVGRLLFGEPLSHWQKAASLLAAIGVGHELMGASQAAWPVFMVALGFPAYYVLRRYLNTDSLAGLWLDVALSLPVAVYFVLHAMPGAGSVEAAFHQARAFGGQILGLGVISASGMLCMIVASQSLPMAMFGLLSYVEPLLLVVVSILIGEHIDAGRMPTYLAIWAAVTLLCAEVFWGRIRLRQRLAGAEFPSEGSPL